MLQLYRINLAGAKGVGVCWSGYENNFSSLKSLLNKHEIKIIPADIHLNYAIIIKIDGWDMECYSNQWIVRLYKTNELIVVADCIMTKLGRLDPIRMTDHKGDLLPQPKYYEKFYEEKNNAHGS